MRLLMAVKGAGKPPDKELFAGMGRFVEELTRAGMLLATGGPCPRREDREAFLVKPVHVIVPAFG